jgi:hypothetical protein
VRKPQVVPDEDHEVIYERVAAVDVAKASGVVCMRTPDSSRPGRFVNRIWDNVPATRARIAELGRELLRCQVQMVTLESTGVIWGANMDELDIAQVMASRRASMTAATAAAWRGRGGAAGRLGGLCSRAGLRSAARWLPRCARRR